ncbi:MAG: DUF5067 domain-containing protein [Clostridiales bacterium]|nr:DUF5067 domain-containing protein [Clostridiales bacterium]
MAILSFIIPLAGLIIFLVDKDKKPKTAKASGICALVSFLINIILIAAITLGGGALLGTALSSSEPSNSSTQNVAGSNNKENTSSDGAIGDYKCVVKEATVCKDWLGKDAVLITFDFTNNSDQAESFDLALQANAYQDGVGLESTFTGKDETDNLIDVEIKPGVTKEVKKAYILRDKSTDIEMEISELFSLTDDKIVTTITLD